MHTPFLSLLALRPLIDLNEIFISPNVTSISRYSRSLLARSQVCRDPKHLHFLLQAGVNLHAPYTTDPEERHKSIFCAFRNLPDYIALMLLFAGGNPKEKIFPIESRPQVRLWLSGFLKAKELFEDMFCDTDLEVLLAFFIFDEQYLRNALG